MTSEEALLEARRRWGCEGFAVFVENHYAVGDHPYEYGRGCSFDAAFIDADIRAGARRHFVSAHQRALAARQDMGMEIERLACRKCGGYADGCVCLEDDFADADRKENGR